MRRSKWRPLLRATAGLLILAFTIAPLRAAGDTPPPPAPTFSETASLRVTGLGWLRSRILTRSLELLLGNQQAPTIDANPIEDASLVIFSELADEGYLDARILVSALLPDGTLAEHELDAELTRTLPRPFSARQVELKVRPGIRHTIKAVAFSGLDAVPAKDAESYFRARQGLFTAASARAYSPGRLRRSLAGLEEALRQAGFAEAVVKTAGIQTDPATGETTVAVSVSQGPLWRVETVDKVSAEGQPSPETLALPGTGRPWSRLLGQDINVAMRRAYQRMGHPDATVSSTPLPGEPAGSERPVRVEVKAAPGPQVRVGAVRFEGATHTKESVLRRRVNLKPGDNYDPQRIEWSRLRLSRLGIFETIDVRDEPSGEGRRDPVFVLRENPRWDAALLFGYGSYEQLRIGLELSQANLWGRAHHSRLSLVQSMKSTRADYTYRVPELFGESVDGGLRLFGLRREEQAFVRREYGGGVTFQRPLPWLRAEGTVGYTYQDLQAGASQLGTRLTDETRTRVASIDLGLTRDTRNNPLLPQRGHRWFLRSEIAAKQLGGETDYQRLEAGFSWHKPLGDGRWLHAGVFHGVVFNGSAVPVNRLFFPGGESSIRGYASGEAAPLDANDRFVGARSQLLLNLEVEQLLTAKWSLVVFFDGLGTTARLNDYPFDDTLASAGLGLRYQTLLGPLRLEYGRNLNPRPRDPDGTLHFSIGFPF